jgi:hypothetical protein
MRRLCQKWSSSQFISPDRWLSSSPSGQALMDIEANTATIRTMTEELAAA